MIRMKKSISLLLIATLLALPVLISCISRVSGSPVFDPSDPLTIPKWVNQISGAPPVYVPTDVYDDGDLVQQEYIVNVTEFDQQILPTLDAFGNPTGFGTTKVWGYGGVAKDAVTGQYMGYVRNSPGPTFEAIRGVPIKVTWINNLTNVDSSLIQHMFAVDPTLHWANPNNIDMMEAIMQAGMGLAPPYPPGYNGTPYPPPDGPQNPNGWNAQSPVPIVTHLHGGETQSYYDGGPEQWFTANGLHGPDYSTAETIYANAAVYEYLNQQEPTTLWYHDHALGITRINVMSGLAGFYLLRDPSDEVAPKLPSGEYEVPLAIQDRSFNPDGSFYFPNVGNNPGTHPYWNPEFFGNTIMVNGLVWPNMNVKEGQYRFRLLDGSNARFYNLSFSNGMSFTQIGTDGGYLKGAATLTSLLIAPGERADILVDFSGLSPGTKIILQNDATSPYPSGDPVDLNTTGQIIQFTVTADTGFVPQSLPAQLNPTLAGAFPNLPSATKQRILTLTEVVNATNDAPLEILLDGQKWAAPVSELPGLGTTEEWVIVNPTMDTHPIHLHLVQFQLVQRQKIDDIAYFDTWMNLNGEPPLDHPTVNLDNLTDYLMGPPITPAPNEQGWKDTIQMNPGEVTTIRVRFATQNGSDFPFDATKGPGYVWHCHIIDHEDNEMMRPYFVVRPSIQSCDSAGIPKDIFKLSQGIYVKGTGHLPSTTYNIYLVNDTTWIEGMPIPQRVTGTATTISSDTFGNVSATIIWNAPLKPGRYDIVVDVNGDGYYNASIDALDESYIEIRAGLLVVSEYWLGTILGLVGCFAALGVFKASKRKRKLDC